MLLFRQGLRFHCRQFFTYPFFIRLSTSMLLFRQGLRFHCPQFFTYQLFIRLSTSVKLTLSTLKVTVQTRAAVSLSSFFHLSTCYRIKYLSQVNFIDAQRCYLSDKGCGFIVVIFTFHWWYDDSYSNISAFHLTRELCLFRRLSGFRHRGVACGGIFRRPTFISFLRITFV